MDFGGDVAFEVEGQTELFPLRDVYECCLVSHSAYALAAVVAPGRFVRCDEINDDGPCNFFFLVIFLFD